MSGSLRRRREFAMVPDSLAIDTRISSHAVRVWIRLDRYAGRSGGALPSRETLAEDLGVSVDIVKRALMDLTHAGWITRERIGSSNVWDTVLHDEPIAPGSARGVTAGRPPAGVRVVRKRSAGPQERCTDAPLPDDVDDEEWCTSAPIPPINGARNGAPVRRPRKEKTRETTTETTTYAHASGDAASDGVIDAEVIDELPLGLPAVIDVRGPDPVQVLVGAYVTAIESCGGIATKAQRGAIGRNVKRLITDDGIPLPVLLVAVQRAGARRSRAVDPFLGDVQAAYSRESTRRAMFDRWTEIAATIDKKGQTA